MKPLDERDRQALALALCELARARPGWLDYLGRVASRLEIRGHFEGFLAIKGEEPAGELGRCHIFAYLAGIAAGTYARALEDLRRGDAEAAAAALSESFEFHLRTLYPDASEAHRRAIIGGPAI